MAMLSLSKKKSVSHRCWKMNHRHRIALKIDHRWSLNWASQIENCNFFTFEINFLNMVSNCDVTILEASMEMLVDNGQFQEFTTSSDVYTFLCPSWFLWGTTVSAWVTLFLNSFLRVPLQDSRLHWVECLHRVTCFVCMKSNSDGWAVLLLGGM